MDDVSSMNLSEYRCQLYRETEEGVQIQLRSLSCDLEGVPTLVVQHQAPGPIAGLQSLRADDAGEVQSLENLEFSLEEVDIEWPGRISSRDLQEHRLSIVSTAPAVQDVPLCVTYLLKQIVSGYCHRRCEWERQPSLGLSQVRSSA
jgi:hypothetical protein